MKKLIIPALLLVGAFFSPTTALAGNDVQLYPIIDESGASNNDTRAPMRPLTIIQEGYQIELPTGHADYALQLLDEDGELAYTVTVSSATTTVVLPTWLSGDYEIRLYPSGSNIHFYGWIELEN